MSCSLGLLLPQPVCAQVHCKNFMVVLTNKYGYLSCTFVLSTLDTMQRYIECVSCVRYVSGRVNESISLLSMTEE